MARDDDDFDQESRPRRPREDADDRPPPKKGSKLPLILGIVALVMCIGCVPLSIGLLLPAVQKIRGAADRMATSNNMKQVGLGLHNYHDTNDGFPTNSYDANGKPLLSWRVHILPHIEQENLYRQFKLDEPWDSPHNRTLLDQMPATYGTAAERRGPRGTKTHLRAFATAGGVMAPAKRPPVKDRNGAPLPVGLRLGDVRDLQDATFLAVEAGEAVEWTKPDDLAWDVGQPLPALGGARGADIFLAIMADGSVKAVKKTVTPEQLKAAITYDGKDPGILP